MKYKIKIYDGNKDVTQFYINWPLWLIEMYKTILNLKIIIEKV